MPRSYGLRTRVIDWDTENVWESQMDATQTAGGFSRAFDRPKDFIEQRPACSALRAWRPMLESLDRYLSSQLLEHGQSVAGQLQLRMPHI
jgi:hypothetical protein